MSNEPSAPGRPPVPDDIRTRFEQRGGRRSWEGPAGAGGPGAATPFPSSVAGPAPQLGAPLAGQLIQYPPDVFPPPAAIDFFLAGSSAGLNSGNTPVVLAGLSFQLPASNVGVVRDFNIYMLGMTASTDVRWRLQLNGVTVSGWDRTILPRVASSIEGAADPASMMVRIPQGNSVAIEIEVLDAGTYQIGASAHGWFYPGSLRAAWERAYR